MGHSGSYTREVEVVRVIRLIRVDLGDTHTHTHTERERERERESTSSALDGDDTSKFIDFVFALPLSGWGTANPGLILLAA